jgi:PPK2 family polyphosphate:nucleotide phosphotransferase
LLSCGRNGVRDHGTALREERVKFKKLIKHYRIDRPGKFRLSDIDPDDTGGLKLDKDEAQAVLADGVKRLTEMQERLYAEDRWAVLLIFQGMDASGKDGAIKHVMSGVNPQGCEVTSFKQPSAKELDHNFLWRAAQALPERGRIGIFNRSYYEETLVARVHKEVLEKQKLPAQLAGKQIWQHRFDDIRGFERHLHRNGTQILKFHLRISKEEQARRFLERLDDPAKRWKFSMGDVAERRRWNDYMHAYEDMIRETSTKHAPWYVIPADDKRFARVMVSEIILDRMAELDLQFPKVSGAALAEMKKVRSAFVADLPKSERKEKA